MTTRQIFGGCDYVFTLLLSLAYGVMMHWMDIPWWGIVAMVHFQTALWFLRPHWFEVQKKILEEES